MEEIAKIESDVTREEQEEKRKRFLQEVLQTDNTYKYTHEYFAELLELSNLDAVCKLGRVIGDNMFAVFLLKIIYNYDASNEVEKVKTFMRKKITLEELYNALQEKAPTKKKNISW